MKEKYGLVGAMCTGKTTLLSLYEDDNRVSTVREAGLDFFSKHPEADRSDYSTLSSLQEMIRERETVASIEEKPVTLTDRTIVDAIVYAFYFGKIGIATMFLDDAVEYMQTYKKFILCSPEGIVFDKRGVRESETSEMRDSLHNRFETFLKVQDLPYTKVSGTIEERRSQVNTIIFK